MIKQQKTRLTYILMCLAAIQFVAIAWFNYRHVYGALDMDAAMGIRQNIEQWKHGLFLEDFIFATTLSNDYVSFWAVPFYFLSGNLNLAMMLSQCLTYFIIVLILWDICSGLELTIDQYLFSVILIFTPYSLDVLEWAYLLFISVGYYAYRVIALLLLFDLLLNCSRPNTGKIKLMILLISSCAVTFWTSLSTGNYILCMVVLPMILKVAWDIIEKQRFSWKNSENWAILLNIISGLMGWIVRNQNMYEIGRNHNDLSLLTADTIFKNLPNAISGFLMLLGGLTNLKDVSIFSWFGLLVLIRLLFIFISIIVVVRACIQKCAKDSLHKVFLCVAVVNIGVLLLTNTSYSEKIFESRYHLVWCIPFLLVVATNVMKAEFRNQWLNHLFAYGFVIIAVVINTGGFYYLHCQTKEKVREQEIIRMADELGIDNVFIYDDPTSAYVLRAMDMEKNIVSVTQERGYMAIHSWGFYASTMENAVSNGPNILICSMQQFELLPSYVKDCYELIETNRLGSTQYVYKSDCSPWDYQVGMPLASESVAIDFPYTVGYSYDGVIDRNGWLLIDSEKQGIVLKSPECSVVPGLYEVTVVYEVAEENIDMLDVELEIASQNGSQVLLSEKLAANQDAVTVSNVNILSEFNLNVQVRKNSPGVISIHKLIFERIGEPIS